MAGFTRRTHVVRIKDPNASGTFLDVEVLDAIAYRKDSGKEEVLDLAASNAAPFIVDDTGGGNAKSPGDPTRRSHMKRVTNKTDSSQQIDVEVLDVIAFRDENGKEWLLDMSATSSAPDAFNLTDGTGSSGSTRRTHTEKISADPKDKDPGQYLAVERCDAMAFRSLRGEEMILVNPSNDDPNSSNPRASTHVTPAGYDATDDGPTPPDNNDPSVYFSFVKGASGCFTNDATLQPGPLWWIRRVTGGEILVIRVDLQKKNLGALVEGSTTVQPGTAHIKQDGNFNDKVPDIEVHLDYPIMPRTSKDGKIDVKTDNIWWTGFENADFEDNWTTLFFLNTAKIMKDDPDGEVRFTLQLPKLVKPISPGTAGTGRWIWAISGGDAFTYVPIHPAPDATNAFEPYPFTDVQGVATYIGLWNTDQAFDLTSFKIFDPGLYKDFVHVNFTPTDFPAANGAYGFATDGGAAAWAAALNAFGIDDYNTSLANAAALASKGVKFTPAPPTLFEPLIIDFDGPNPPNTKIPELTTTVTAMAFTGKSAFDRDEPSNIPTFAAPTDPTKTATASFGHVADFAGSLITVLMTKDKKGKISITITEGPAPGTVG